MGDFNITKKAVDQILEKYAIVEIETALIEGFLEENNITPIKNQFIKNSIKNSQNSSKVKKYFKEKLFEFTLKNIERFFELLIPAKDRSINGAFYTPEFIVEYIIGETIKDDQRICDPSCGSGAFLVAATEKIIKMTGKKTVEILENNIFGCDILDYNIRRTKIILTLLALKNKEDVQEIHFNIECGDSLKIDWHKLFPRIFPEKIKKNSNMGFDAIVGNPPYVRIQDLDEKAKSYLNENFLTTGRGAYNLYFAFFELGISILKEGGQLGYIVPNSYFTSFAAETLRKWLQENRYLKEIIDFTHLRVFNDATTYTCITLLDKNKKEHFLYNYIYVEKNLKIFAKQKSDKINFSDIVPKKWRLLKIKDFTNIKNIENIGVPLGITTKINSGIATLQDKLFFVDERQRENGTYEKKFEGKTYKIPKELVREVIKISDMDNDKEVKENTRRIIFPYKKIDKKFEIIPEKEMKKDFPKCYNYFLAIKEVLAGRDKGMKKYPEWYAYGRSQGFANTDKKLLTPTFSKNPKFMLDETGNSFFCNGYALSKSKIDLKILQKILNSSVMDYYIRQTSVNIGGGFPCFQKNFIERFTIPEFDKKELNFLSKESNKDMINQFLEKKYEIVI
jgi:adenine-specific DNA-methyltransferase